MKRTIIKRKKSYVRRVRGKRQKVRKHRQRYKKSYSGFLQKPFKTRELLEETRAEFGEAGLSHLHSLDRETLQLKLEKDFNITPGVTHDMGKPALINLYRNKYIGGLSKSRRSFGSNSLISIKKKGKTITTRKPKEVLKLGKQIKKRLKPLTNRIDLAGSIRRKTGNYIDIDVVAIPKDKERIKKSLRKMGKPIQEGNKKIGYNIKNVKTEVYFATPKDYGANLLFATGSGGHNIGLRKIAKEKGMKLNQYGLWKNNKLIASKSEKGIYKALGRPKFKQPEERT